MSAAEVVNIADHLKIKTKLVCSGCGAPGEGSCGCGVAYVKAGVRAEEVVKANPGKSNRAIAEESGLGLGTVQRARKKVTDPNGSVEKRTGKDGRTRAMPKPKPPKPAPPIKAKDVKGRVAGIDIKVAPTIWQEFNERAQREQRSASAKINEMIVNEIESGVDFRAELPKSAQEKLDAAMRQYQRKLDAEHAERMRGADEEVRKRVIAEGKTYVASMKELEAKAWADQKHWREMTELLKHPLTIEEFKLILMCLHPDGERTEEKLASAFRLFNSKRKVLLGER